jgi:hypothetical protein
MTPEQAHRLLEVEYLVLEYEMTMSYGGTPPLVARSRIGKWRNERQALRRIAERAFAEKP